MPKLRVALVALYPAPGAKAPGGVRVVVQNLVQVLRTYEDLQIELIHCHSDIEQDAVVQDGSIRVHYLAMPRRRVVPNTLASIGRVQRVLQTLKPDVVNAHGPHYAIAALRSGLPTIYTIHGVMHREAEVYRSLWFDRLRYVLERACDRYAVQHVHEIVAISPYVLQEYAGWTAARFHRIDNPLPNEYFELAGTEEPMRLLYPGTIDERKNVLGLLEAVALVRKQLPHVRLHIAGRATSPQYAKKLEDAIDAQGLSNHVSLLGLLSQSELLQEYARCAVVVLASHEETAPMAVLEAMAVGRPVVATRVGGVADLVEDGRSGFTVPAGDMRTFAERLVTLLTDAELRRTMGRHARTLAERFHAERIAAQYRQLYYQVAGKGLP